MLNLSEYLGVTIKGNNQYECMLSPSGMIIRTVPDSPYLLDKGLQEIYTQTKGRISILRFYQVEPPKILDSEKFPEMEKKSSALAYLYKKFDCDML